MRSREAVQQDDGDDVQQALWAPVGHLLALRMERECLAEHLRVWNEACIWKDVASDSD